MKTAIQLFTLRTMNAPLSRIVEVVDETPFDGVELATIPDNPKAVGKALATSDVAVAGMHVRAERIESEFGSVVATCEALDCDTVTIPYADAAHFESKAAVNEFATDLSRKGERLAERGLRLLYHNHGHEFSRFGERTAFEQLLEETSECVGFELDVGWIGSAGMGPLEVFEWVDGRCPMVHVTDVEYETHTPVELGAGDVDVLECVRAARDLGCEWVVYEHDEPESPTATLENGSRTIDELVHRAHG